MNHTSASPVPIDVADKRDRLLELLQSLESCVVAFSGGVDSAVVAKAAYDALGQKALAVTAVSPSLATCEREAAREIAQAIGIRHCEIQTNEFSKTAYTRNAPDRCYFCKTELYSQLADRCDEFGVRVIINGANLDDAGDFRPGQKAATEHRVRSPLAECGFTKSDVRALAAYWGLAVWDKPAQPCLSSRIAYGEEVTPERLAMVDRGEDFLRNLGFVDLRVRYHRGDLARIEVPADVVKRLTDPATRQAIVSQFTELGFKFVTVDLQGFRPGSLNALVTIDQLQRLG
jgi:uncharacterized protein